jgi:hypothetical protein
VNARFKIIGTDTWEPLPAGLDARRRSCTWPVAENRAGQRFAEAGATTAVQAREDVVPASQLREAYAKIRELERAPAARRWKSRSCARLQEI